MRKTKEDTEITKQNILKACYEIVLEKGFERMTQNDIADKLGMTRGAVNWHFKTKEEIYLATLEWVLELLKKERENSVNDESMNVMNKLKKMFVIPLDMADYFHFVNQIPHYLLEQDNFKEIECKKNRNREWFMGYMKDCLSEYEIEKKCKLTKSKDEIAHVLYLVYEGLHNRDVNYHFKNVNFMNELDDYFKIIIY